MLNESQLDGRTINARPNAPRPPRSDGDRERRPR